MYIPYPSENNTRATRFSFFFMFCGHFPCQPIRLKQITETDVILYTVHGLHVAPVRHGQEGIINVKFEGNQIKTFMVLITRCDWWDDP